MDAVLTLFDGRSAFGRLLPGLAIVVAVAVLAMLLRLLPGLSMFSPLMLAVLIGVALGHLYHPPPRCLPGIGFAGRRILRLAIVLLGLQLSATQLLAIGLDGFVIATCVVAITFIAVAWMGPLLGVDARLAGLIAAGTSICGASAVAAMSTVNQASEEDVTYAMAAVTVFGTILMFLLPAAGHTLGLPERAFGIWAGVSIHEVAQVTGATFQYGNVAGETGIIVKLTRVMMLAPLVLVVGLRLHRRRSAGNEDAAPPVVPLFVLGFIAAAALNSVVSIPADIRASLMSITTFLLALALAALGLQAHVSRLKAKGVRPLALGALGTVLIVGLSLGLVMLANWVA
ncbi:YeiH family protein [Pseudorhodoplanes sinuspersici]|uniref:Uncharacterized protein n=1 Tax=Pseudorhodoplanes sinuspersici TaxID=1235591 RepID=A0A1W6ZLP5_9HYPH|nr:YeiH family protein [Pseudorhodoplanes sinuspersici]ARP98232.1 hypothetical protein CAK95_03355 [Pseudorhodoplanes sinuspersici]RKE68012.1 putative integral membrane protein (TIGR00698 family) [Pseudorhodoplanes sinuspersici]